MKVLILLLAIALTSKSVVACKCAPITCPTFDEYEVCITLSFALILAIMELLGRIWMFRGQILIATRADCPVLYTAMSLREPVRAQLCASMRP